MRRYSSDLLNFALLFLLPLVLFWSQTVGGKTLLPVDNLYQFEPHATYSEVVGAPDQPHNPLLSDLILQNYQWKAFIRSSISAREIPLWNPHQLSGLPFLAAGQQSALYPPSVLYYVLPLTAAYGWFTVVNLWLAGMFMFLLMRGLGTSRAGALLAGIVYQLCGFFVASAVHPMIIGAGAWLPLLLLMAEYIIRRRAAFGRETVIPWIAIGAGALACNIFAGHIEITIYSLLIAGYYSGFRLLWALWKTPAADRRAGLLHMMRTGGALLGMVILGLVLGAAQFIPLYEFASTNWRAERADLATVRGYAHPVRDALLYAMPNFYGNETHTSYIDVFTGERVTEMTNAAGDRIQRINWGIKNYVEGALHVGILPLVLAAVALLDSVLGRRRRAADAEPPYRLIFMTLALLALTFMFGMATYALVFALPGLNQLNTPFRWVIAVTLAVAALAGFGLDALARPGDARFRRWAGRMGMLAGLGGVFVLAGLGGIWALFDRFESLFDGIVNRMALADTAFADGRAFFSYQFPNAAIFGGLLLLSGLIVWWAARGTSGTQARPSRWQFGAVALVAVDLLAASWGFNPAADPALLDFTPPAVEWLLDRRAEEGPFRYTTIDDPTRHTALMQPNVTMRYGLDDVRGYDSIISAQYVAYMRETSLQNQLDANRIAPIFFDRLDDVDWNRLNLLNARYIVTHVSTDLPASLLETRLELAHEDEATRIYRNTEAVPRAFLTDDAPFTVEEWNFAYHDGAASIISAGGRERLINARLAAAESGSWLVISESYAPGWRAFIRPGGAGDDLEIPLEVERVLENFIGVRIPAELLELFDPEKLDDLDAISLAALEDGLFTVRVVYSPMSFQVGVFGSVIAAALMVFMLGIWLWRLFVAAADDGSSAVSRVARNSIAPIVLNLFNRGIDFAFAFVMLRILGPEDAGFYYYAIVVFVWFDILTNFGLDVFLIREVSRQRERAGHYLLNTSVMRLSLMLACVPLLLGFLLVRQSIIAPPLTGEALLAIGLLYIGLAPGSLNKGLTSLFYAFEKAEYPAAVTTVTTINKAIFGLGVLLLGYGIVGLAAVSIGVNIITLLILLWAARGMIGKVIQRRPDRPLIRGMTRESWPLMLNHFLATIFFQIDIVILEALQGARIVGQYSVAYRWLLALNIIPAFFTQALLPVMSRQASEDRAALKRTYTLGIKLLVAIAIPLAVVFTFTAEALTWLLGGAEFLPGGAIALQIMIWSIPFGWMNSLTQYALIAVDLQRKITRAFVIAVTFNIVTNLIFIPIYGYQAAAVTTILSEMVLLIPFGVLLQRALGKLNWFGMVWRQASAGAVMLGAMLILWPLLPMLALIAGGLIYPVILLLLRPLSREELDMITPLLPGKLKRFAPGLTA